MGIVPAPPGSNNQARQARLSEYFFNILHRPVDRHRGDGRQRQLAASSRRAMQEFELAFAMIIARDE
jgi:hypothetical protein